MVVAFHASQVWSLQQSGNPGHLVWAQGASGVDIFFAISGFVMAVSSIGKGSGLTAAWRFLQLRFVRIFPLYWIATTLLLLKLKLAPAADVLHRVQLPAPYVLASYLLLPFRNSLGAVQPILIPGWTLSYEIFFYVCFAAALLSRKRVDGVLVAVLLPLAILGLFRSAAWPAFTVLFDPLLLEFLAGLLLGCAWQNGRRCPPYLAAALGTLALLTLFLAPLPHGMVPLRLACGTMAFLVVQAAVALEPRFGASVPGWLMTLGDASYSLYLSHYLLMYPLARLLARSHIIHAGSAALSQLLLSLSISQAVSIAVAVVLFQTVEQPLGTKLRQALGLSRSPTSLRPPAPKTALPRL